MSAQQPTIAVVDDDPSLRTSLHRLLMVSGYKTELYGSAEQLSDGIAVSGATCLLIDCHIGDSSGLDLAQRLAVGGCSLPVIFMTASDDRSVRNRAMDLGCVAFLKKPFSASQLLDALAKTISAPILVG